MTIKEMIKKVDTYNEVARSMSEWKNKAELHVKIGNFGEIITVKDFKSFKSYMKAEYIDCVADAILNCADYHFDTEINVHAADYYGNEWTEPVHFWVYE